MVKFRHELLSITLLFHLCFEKGGKAFSSPALFAHAWSGYDNLDLKQEET